MSMSRLPARLTDDGLPSRQLARAVQAQRCTELAVFEHSLEARYVAECERIDAQALSDVVRTALEEEITNLDWGLEQAAGSAAKTELVARKSVLQSKLNDARIARRFGG
jgi:hypothetical protein